MFGVKPRFLKEIKPLKNINIVSRTERYSFTVLRDTRKVFKKYFRSQFLWFETIFTTLAGGRPLLTSHTRDGIVSNFFLTVGEIQHSKRWEITIIQFNWKKLAYRTPEKNPQDWMKSNRTALALCISHSQKCDHIEKMFKVIKLRKK